MTEDRFRFDALTADNATTDVEYTDTAAGQWQVLTNLSAFGGFTNVVDPAGVSVVTQRFYRLNLRKN